MGDMKVGVSALTAFSTHRFIIYRLGFGDPLYYFILTLKTVLSSCGGNPVLKYEVVLSQGAECQGVPAPLACCDFERKERDF